MRACAGRCDCCSIHDFVASVLNLSRFRCCYTVCFVNFKIFNNRIREFDLLSPFNNHPFKNDVKTYVACASQFRIIWIVLVPNDSENSVFNRICIISNCIARVPFVDRHRENSALIVCNQSLRDNIEQPGVVKLYVTFLELKFNTIGDSRFNNIFSLFIL